jgi:geranylgeranyl pyrophosphate synthase
MNLNTIYQHIKDDLDKVEQSLESVANVDIPLLSKLLEYLLKNGGKRIRPSLTLLSGKFYNYNLNSLIPMATAVELLHNATLVHDDIVDNAPIRRGKQSISRAWGEASALLLGDYLFARAGRLVASTENLRAVKLFAQTLMTISSGELAQINVLFDKKRALEHYYAWISAKTACLFSMATESGAVLSQAPEDMIDALKNYGHNFGMAFQVIDDVLDFTGRENELGKPVGSDLIEGAITLPAILFAESNPDGCLIKSIIENKDIEKVAVVVEKIRTSPVIDECLDIASDFCSKACQSLDKLPDSSSRQALLDLATYSIQRRK